MFYNEIFDKNIFNSKLAIKYGFSKIGDYYILQSNIDVENLQQLFSYSESTQRVLLQTYLNRFPDLNLTKAQFAEVRQILKTNLALLLLYSIFDKITHF